MTRPEGDWDLVHRELANPGFDLPPIDRLEAFNPNGRCIYKRVLMAVESQDCLCACWYGLAHILRGSVRLSDGHWDGKKFG
jgi:hypothetical protein